MAGLDQPRGTDGPGWVSRQRLVGVLAALATAALGAPGQAADASFWPKWIIAGDQTHEPTSVFAADVDGDGDIDVLSASRQDDKIAWYENTDAAGTFGAQQVISTAAVGAVSVFAADLDGDGDTDVLSASFRDDKIAWYENLLRGRMRAV